MLADASNFVQPVDNTFIFIVVICVFFLALITTLMITFVIKYNSKKNKKAKNIEGNYTTGNYMDSNSTDYWLW